MESKQSTKAPVRARQVVIRVIICLIVLLLGLLVMNKLSSLKRPPTEAKRPEQTLQVEGVIVKREDARVILTGYGEIKTLNTVSISSEISGRVIDVHPRLEPGEIIPRGATLFKIDPRIHTATLQEANASLQQLKISVLRLEKQFAIDRERQKTIERNRDLTSAQTRTASALVALRQSWYAFMTETGQMTPE
jgi:multidrug efflux system membrane fusion protein